MDLRFPLTNYVRIHGACGKILKENEAMLHFIAAKNLAISRGKPALMGIVPGTSCCLGVTSQRVWRNR